MFPMLALSYEQIVVLHMFYVQKMELSYWWEHGSQKNKNKLVHKYHENEHCQFRKIKLAQNC